MALPIPSSLAHQHVAAVINTILGPRVPPAVLRILDFGCGRGEMLAYLLTALSELRPGMRIEAYGLDVADSGVQDPGFLEDAKLRLSAAHPAVDWAARLTLTTTSSPWPYASGCFDFIVSNQVLEHVTDHAFLFGEIRRCLAPGGVSVNHFPAREVIMEWHALQPLVHRIRNVELREKAMLLLARLGFRGHFRREMQRRGWRSLEEFAATFSRVLETDTNYRTIRQHCAMARAGGLAASFQYTKDFYVGKLMSYFGRRSYRYAESAFFDWLGVTVGKRIASVTMLLRPVGLTADESVEGPPDEHEPPSHC